MRADDKIIKYLKKWFSDNKENKYKWIDNKMGRSLKQNLIDSGNWRKKKRQNVPLPAAFIKNRFKKQSPPDEIAPQP